MTDQIHNSITKIVSPIGKTKDFRLNVDGSDVIITVDAAIFAHYKNQLVRKRPTDRQGQLFATLHNLMRSAYKKGFADGKKTNEPNQSA